MGDDPIRKETKTPETWDEGDSRDFIRFGDYFVPERELQDEIVCALIPDCPEGTFIVELCCADGHLTRAMLVRHQRCRVIALDGSPEMLERAGAVRKEYGGRVDLREFALSDAPWHTLPAPPHAVVSSLAVHHLDAEQKQNLFREVFRALETGGVFVVADLVLPQSEPGAALAARQWDDAVRERSLLRRGDLSAFERFQISKWNFFSDPSPDPIDQPSPLIRQLNWLEDAGFSEVDVYWMKAGHAIFGGRKAGSGAGAPG